MQGTSNIDVADMVRAGAIDEGETMNAEVKGTTMPILDVTLGPGEEVISTHGQLSWMTSNIEMSQSMNTGSGKGPRWPVD